jgi:hypothetical protein
MFIMETAMLGLSEVDITPSSPIQTVGFGRGDELSRGVLHSLSAQVSVWQLSSGKCCIAAIDHIGFSRQHADRLRDEIGEILSISKDKVMLCFSHTHSAPNDSIETEYSNYVDARIKGAVREAAENMAPVKATWGNSYGDIGVNRREDCDMLDRRIGILKVVDADSGKLRQLLLRLTAHANVLKEDNYLISPDYFGAVRDLLAEKYGCMVMLSQGASGNISPRFYTTGLAWTADNPAPSYYGKYESASALSNMAEEVYHQVDRAIDEIHPRNVEYLDMYSVYQKLDADVPNYKKALEIAAEAKQEAHIDGTAWLSEVRGLIQNGVEKQTDDVELQYFGVNDGCLCGVPNEIMCEFALRTSNMLNSELFYLGGYTNGCTGYFPTEEEYDKGGYEVYWSMLIYYIYHGRVSPLNRDSAARLIETAADNAPQSLKHNVK